MTNGCDCKPGMPDTFSPSRVRLYGTPLSNPIETRIGGISLTLGVSPDGSDYHLAVIHGYSFEGHCYELPKPRILIVKTQGAVVLKDDCGYSPDLNYRYWDVDKDDDSMALDVESGIIERLVLDVNVPGRRSAASYRATAMLAHRGGRLTE